MVNVIHVDRDDRTWLFYLLQPLRLISDSALMSIDEQLALMKQFLSNAEVSEKKASSSVKCDSETFVLGSIKNGDSLIDNSQQPYKKCKILDSLALQLASLLKFNLNLFRNMYEIPVRLVARLYRVLVTTTARYSHTLQLLFDQAEDKDSIYIINPYASFHWDSLHPSTVYSIMSYHIWCLQVCLSSSMVPPPFRNLTPVVAGLTEVPDTAFFPDNRLEVNVILNRIGESVQQLVELSQQLPNLIVARPLPTLFTPTGPGLPPALQASAFTVPEDKRKELYDAEPLSFAYVSASLDFVLGRYEFQQHQFHKAEQHFKNTLCAIKEEKLLHAVEVGLTMDLLETYLKACQSFHLVRSPSCPGASLKPDISDSTEFPIDLIVTTLSRCISMDHESPSDWNELGDIEASENALCELMIKQNLNDFWVFEEPVGSLLNRYQLQQVLSRRLQYQLQIQMQSNICQGREAEGRHSLKLHKSAVQSYRRLYTKVYIANAIGSMLTGSPSDAVWTVDLLLNNSQSTTTLIDPVVGQQFLLDSLADMLNSLTLSSPEDGGRRAPDSQRKHLMLSQFISYVISLAVSDSDNSDQAPQMASGRQQKCQDFLHALAAHDLIKCLSLPDQTLVRTTATRSTLKKDRLSDSDTSAMHQIPDEMSPGLDHTGLLLLRGFGLSPRTWGLGAYFNNPLDICSADGTPDAFASAKDVDMRNLPLLAPPPPTPPSFHAAFAKQQPQPGHHFHHWQASLGPQQLDSNLTALVSLSEQSRLLSTSIRPLDIVSCVAQLHRLGVAPDQILQLHSAWCPCLRRLTRLEVMPLAESVDDNLPGLVYSNPGFLVPLIQLAKAASLIERSAAVNAIPARTLLLAAYACPSGPDSGYTSCPATSAFILWLKAVIRHELLLADLLEALSSSNLQPNPGGAVKPRQTRAHLIELTRQVKVCLFHATGLSSHASTVDSKADDVNCFIALSPRLVNLAVVFLLYTKEDAFLLPHGKSSPAASGRGAGLPKGALPASRTGTSCAGSVELVRALLRLYRALPAPPPVRPDHCATSTVANSADCGGESESGLQGEEREAGKSTGDSRMAVVGPDPLKTSINNLWNLLLFRCVLPALYQPVASSTETGAGGRSRSSNGRCQLQPSTILDLAETLALAAAAAANQHSTVKESSKATTTILLAPEKLSGDEQLHRGPPPAPKGASCHLLLLLLELIFCLVHIAKHAVAELQPAAALLLVSADDRKAAVASSKDPVSHVSPASRPTDPRLSADSSAAAAAAGTTAANNNNNNNSTSDWESQPLSKRRCWDETASTAAPQASITYPAEPYQAVMLLRCCSLWPKELPSDVQLSSSGICQLLLPLIECALSTGLSHSDWLLSLFRAEILLAQGHHQEAFRAYLEAFLCETDGFTKPVSDDIPESVIRQVVCCCQHLGLLTEAVVFCQFRSGRDSAGGGGGLIDLAVNIIRGSSDDTLPRPSSSSSTTTATVATPAPTVATTTTTNTTSSANNNNSVGDTKAPGQQLGQGEASLSVTTTTTSSTGSTQDPLALTAGSAGAVTPSCCEQMPPRGACGGWVSAAPFDRLDDSLVDYLWNVRLLETLASVAYCRGALGQHAKFSAQLSLPELNVNNPPEVLQETASIRGLEFLRHLAVAWIG